MDARLKKLLNKEVLTPEQIEEIEEHEEVAECVHNGYSSNAHLGYNWFSVTTTSDEKFEVYCKY